MTLKRLKDNFVLVSRRSESSNLSELLSHTSAKTESENNRRAAQGTVTEMHPAAH